jgi:hypothetical protein
MVATEIKKRDRDREKDRRGTKRGGEKKKENRDKRDGENLTNKIKRRKWRKESRQFPKGLSP